MPRRSPILEHGPLALIPPPEWQSFLEGRTSLCRPCFACPAKASDAKPDLCHNRIWGASAAPEEASQHRERRDSGGDAQSEHRVAGRQEGVVEVGDLEHCRLGCLGCGLDQPAAAPGCLVLPLRAHHGARCVYAQIEQEAVGERCTRT